MLNLLLVLLVLLMPVSTLADGTLTDAANPPIAKLSDNPLANPFLDVWQRGTAFAAAANSSYSADQWKWFQVGGAVVTINRSTIIPTLAQAGVVLNYSLEIDVTTADAAITGADQYALSTFVEGFNWKHFANKPFVLSFCVLDTIPGEHAIQIANAAADRSYIAVYYISAADTWECKSINIPAPTLAVTWDTTTGIGAYIIFTLTKGSNSQGTGNAWQTGNVGATATTVNPLSSTSNFFRVTAVKIEAGTMATPLQYRSFEENLALCQRYYQKSFLYATAPVQSAGAGTGEFTFPALQAGATAQRSPQMTFPVRMRAAPTMTLYNPSAANGAIRDETAAADLTATASVATERGFHVTGTGAAGTAIANLLGIHWAATADF